MNVQRLVVFLSELFFFFLILSTFYSIVKWECSSLLRSRADCQLDIETSLVAVFLAVVDVWSVCFALHAQLRVQSEVGELDGDQRLEVLGLQLLAVVRIVLQREAFAQAKVLDLANLAFILFSLQTHTLNLSINTNTADKLADASTQNMAGSRHIKHTLFLQ